MKQEACQLFIEQEIDDGLGRGETPYQIAKVLTEWVEKLFHAKIPHDTIERRAQRTKAKIGTNVPMPPTTPIDYTNRENQDITWGPGFKHGGPREGAGRPPKFTVLPDNTQFRTSGTGENEWYTPLKYIEAARDALGDIDLDPASSEFGQSRVQAAQYFTVENDGLTQPWYGSVWLNPPYSQPLIQQFIEKLIHEYRSARVDSAILLVHNYTDTRWFHIAEAEAEAICFTLGRIKFEGADGSVASPTQGQAFLYYGPQPGMFYERFKDIGFVR